MEANSPKKRKLIGSVQRALDILNLFSMQKPELSLTEFAQEMKLTKSTVAGLVATLEENRVLARDPKSKKYRLGMKLLELGDIVRHQTQIQQVAFQYLETLRNWCDESVNLAVLDDGYVVYIERLFGSKMLGMRSEIGKRERAHSTALGKSILAMLPPGEVQAYVQRYGLPSITPHTITNQQIFIEELQRVRQDGYAVDNEENEVGGRCIAAPVMDYTGRPIAAISISIPLQRIPLEQIPVFGSQICETARKISDQLGFSAFPIEEQA